MTAPNPSPAPVPTYAGISDAAIATDYATNYGLRAYFGDLQGRIWRIDLQAKDSNGNPSPGAATIIYTPSSGTHPIYYSPAVMAVTDTSGNATGDVLVAAMDGSFDDTEINSPYVASPPVPNMVIFTDHNGTATNVQTTALNSSAICDPPASGSCKGRTTCATCTGGSRFTSNARPTSSPIILRNLASDATATTQIIFLIYDPGTTAGCATGLNSFVVLDQVTPGTYTQSVGESVQSQGKAAGMALSSGGEIVIGASQSAASTLQVVAGSAKQVATTSGKGLQASIRGVSEVDD
jgi:Tfp pilus tip-associated adhesin PilY1